MKPTDNTNELANESNKVIIDTTIKATDELSFDDDELYGPGEKVCPKCGKTYTGYPAVSRRDGTTYICSECGIREAFDDWGIDKKKQEELLEERRQIIRERQKQQE